MSTGRILFVLFVGAACAPRPSTTPDAGSRGGVVIGSDGPVFDFAPLDDGAAIRVVHGPQGGYHVWLSVGLDGTWSDVGGAVGLEYAMEAGSQAVGQGRSVVEVERVSSGYVARGVVMLLDVDPSTWTGRDLRVRVNITVKSGGPALSTVVRHWMATCCQSTRAVDAGMHGMTTCADFCTTVAPCSLYATACDTECAGWSASGLEAPLGDTRECRFNLAASSACSSLAGDIAVRCVDDCAYYCALMQAFCPQVAFTTDTCRGTCAGYRVDGLDGDDHGNTLQCRIAQAEHGFAAAVACGWAGPQPRGLCVN